MIELAQVEEDQRSLWIEACARERWGLGEGWEKTAINFGGSKVAIDFKCAFGDVTTSFSVALDEFLEWLSDDA